MLIVEERMHSKLKIETSFLKIWSHICWTKSPTLANCIPSVNTLSQLRFSYPNYKSEKLNLVIEVWREK